jgi:hypothetical protein
MIPDSKNLNPAGSGVNKDNWVLSKEFSRVSWWKIRCEALDLQVCQKRTRGTVNRLASKNPNGLKLYSKIILEQLDRGFIEKVPSSEMSKPSHYIPHFGVFKESATTPLRIVYDCSCETPAGVSLNDCLEIGPPLQNDMLAILLRFRAHTIGLTADWKGVSSSWSTRAGSRFRAVPLAKGPIRLKIGFRVVPFPRDPVWCQQLALHPPVSDQTTSTR